MLGVAAGSAVVVRAEKDDARDQVDEQQRADLESRADGAVVATAVEDGDGDGQTPRERKEHPALHDAAEDQKDLGDRPCRAVGIALCGRYVLVFHAAPALDADDSLVVQLCSTMCTILHTILLNMISL